MFKISTVAVHGGTDRDLSAGAVTTPVFSSTSFRYLNEGDMPYPRYLNTPNHKVTAAKIAALERGEKALVFASGLAAISAVFMGHLKPGNHILVQADVYGGIFHLADSVLKKFGIEITFVRGHKVEDFREQLKPNTKMLYLESPSNPLLSVVNLRGMAAFAKENNLISVVDNTFATPVNQQPLLLDIDIVLHSGTKYLSGHSDLMCGVVVTSEMMMEHIYEAAIMLGGTLPATELALLERSLKTLVLRVEKQNSNALTVARFLERHPKIEKVNYPGLESHPSFRVASGQMKGFGGMLSFTVKGDASIVLKNTELIQPALSLGGVESIFCMPVHTSHLRVPAEEREAMGITDNLIRLSVGIEDADDICTDLNNSLALV